MDKSEKTHISQVIAILLSAVISASLFAGYMLYQYNPSGHYLAGNILLSPTVLKEMHIPEKKSSNKNPTVYVFDKIQFSYFDPNLNKIKTVDVPLNTYSSFYDFIFSDESLVDDEATIEKHFGIPKTVLTISTHPQGSADSQIFERVEFTDKGDYYRVQLKDDNRWIYFKHPQIYEEIKRFYL